MASLVEDGGDAGAHFTSWCARQGICSHQNDAEQHPLVTASTLANYLEGLGFPNTAETLALICSVCQSVNRKDGLLDSAEFCPLFMPAFRAALEQLGNGGSALSSDTETEGSESGVESNGDDTSVLNENNGLPQSTSAMPSNFGKTRRLSSDAIKTTEEIQNLVTSSKINVERTQAYSIANEKSEPGATGTGGETKVQKDEYTPAPLSNENDVEGTGLISNPISQSANQLQFGEMLNLQKVGSNSWEDESVSRSWSTVPASHFLLRGANYLSDRKKQESDFAIYEPVSVDIFQTDKRWFCTADAFWMPEIPAEKEINGMPTRLTIEITFPSFPAENAVWGTQKKNGPSHVWLASFVLSEKAKKQLREGNEAGMTPGLKLAKEFCSKNDPHHSAFKTIIKMDNHDDPKVSNTLGMVVRGLLSKYNAKPYLSNKSHRVVRVSDRYKNVQSMTILLFCRTQKMYAHLT